MRAFKKLRQLKQHEHKICLDTLRQEMHVSSCIVRNVVCTIIVHNYKLVIKMTMPSNAHHNFMYLIQISNDVNKHFLPYSLVLKLLYVQININHDVIPI